MNLLWAWNELLIAMVLLQDDSMKTLMVGITIFQSHNNLNVPVTMAGLLIATVPVGRPLSGRTAVLRAGARGGRREGVGSSEGKQMSERVLITGAASGIGRATARLLAGAGWTVIALDRNEAGLHALSDELGPWLIPE